MHTRTLATATGFALLASCGSSGGTRSTAIDPATVSVLACRARSDDPFRFAEIALRDDRNLGLQRIADRTGTERDARLHPDGNRVVFTRERTAGDRTSREVFLSSIDGSVAELRLTQNSQRDDEPCWSPAGDHVLFTSDRSGTATLWRCALDGSSPEVLVAPPVAGGDGEPDCHATTNRLVWSRADGAGRHVLWIAAGDGSSAAPLTDGGIATGSGNGDRRPSFSADGSQVVFVRSFGPNLAQLCTCTIGSGAVTVRAPVAGSLDWPRFAPAGDRLFFGLAEPLAGRASLRLATIDLAGSAPVLVWPDERWALTGLDLRPSLPEIAAANSPTTLDVTRATLEIAAASNVNGSKSMLTDVDGSEYLLETTTFDGREIAGLNVRFDLPVLVANDVLELRIRSTARTTRADGQSKLRMSIYNPVDQRFDTAVEITPGSTTQQAMAFTTSSLRHLTKERQLRVTVIADLDPGSRAQLWIDQVEVVLVARAN